MKTEEYEAIYKLDAHWPDIDPEHDQKRSRFLLVNEAIAQSYRDCETKGVVEIKCNLKSMNQEQGRVQITVGCEDMSYELVRFASTKLFLRFVDAHMKVQTLEFYAAESDCEYKRHKPHTGINCIPVPRVSLYLTSKTYISDNLLIYKSIPDCTLIVSARGVWPSQIKSWDCLSSLEITHRCFMKMLFSPESVGAACEIYNTRIDGDILFRMKDEGEPLSSAQKQALAFLQDLQELYVNLAG